MKKSIKTLKQLKQVKLQLKQHEENIALLNAFSKNGMSFNKKQYYCTKKIDHRIRWTIKNINAQMEILRHELTVLMEYGA